MVERIRQVWSSINLNVQLPLLGTRPSINPIFSHKGGGRSSMREEIQVAQQPPEPPECRIHEGVGSGWVNPSRPDPMAELNHLHPTSDDECWVENRNERLPSYIAPETPLQKKMRRELGKIGPLTPVQIAQITAYQLGSPSANRAKHMKDLKVKLETAPFLSLARWERIRSWQETHLEYDTEWDEDVRRDLVNMQQNIVYWRRSGNEEN
ncbi:hypothetical protein C8R45DRAFT_927657 [Mycena sanguinolenta]|nr:hypothetical protein C8R45DRAFT_927657 [Mycena sanguinolenta]